MEKRGKLTCHHMNFGESCVAPNILREFKQCLAVVRVLVFVCQRRDFASEQCSCACKSLVIQLNAHQAIYYYVECECCHTSSACDCANETHKYMCHSQKYDFGDDLSTKIVEFLCYLQKSQCQNECTCVWVRVLRVWQQFLHALFFALLLELYHFFFFSFHSLGIKCSFFSETLRSVKLISAEILVCFSLSSSHLLHFYISDAQSTHHHC